MSLLVYLLLVCKIKHVHFVKKLVVAGFFALILNSAYLAASASPHMFYVANVFYHIMFGLLLIPTLLVEMGRIKRILHEIGGCGSLLGWSVHFSV